LYHHRLLKDENDKYSKVHKIQKWWGERLVKIHIRYQSPQTSCPEITRIMILKFSGHARSELLRLAQNVWLFENFENFAAILKCMFILQQLRDKHGIDKFSQKMSIKEDISHNDDLPIGFEYCDDQHHQVIPVGYQLSLFFKNLYRNDVRNAILHANGFTQYAINNAKLVQLNDSDSLGDLVSLMEFTMSLIFTANYKCCHFYLPRAYLVNYFEVFTVKPLLLDKQHAYNKEGYLAAIDDSFNQIKKLLLQVDSQFTQIILRLIRLLVLITLNEPTTFTQKVFPFFNSFNNKIFSSKTKEYLLEHTKSKCSKKLMW